MKKQSSKRRRKKSQPGQQGSRTKEEGDSDTKQNLDSLTLRFEKSLNVENPYANVNMNVSIIDDPSTSSASSGKSSSLGRNERQDSSLGRNERQDMVLYGKKPKKVVAVTGTVSSILGKDYVRKDVGVKSKDFGNVGLEKEDAEQFLVSMLGDDCELSLAVVRDVLCQCGYDVQKGVDALLDLTASDEQSIYSRSLHGKINNVLPLEQNDSMTDRSSDCTSSSSESDPVSFWGYDCRNYAQALNGFEAPSAVGNNQSDLPQKVLDALFKNSKSSEPEPGTMNWRNVVKRMQMLGPRIDLDPSREATSQQDTCARDEYHLFRKPAAEHWDSMRSYYQKAASAYSKGKREYAAYLSNQGRVQTQLAQVAENKASQHIFKARNKTFDNVITIDLHGQHVKEAMKLLKIHLLFGSYAQSFQTLRVITGCGSHGVGKSKLKQSVVKLLENEGITWSEENRGTLLIKIEGNKEYGFLDLDSDGD